MKVDMSRAGKSTETGSSLIWGWRGEVGWRGEAAHGAVCLFGGDKSILELVVMIAQLCKIIKTLNGTF
jgi:hypothetical protein